MTPKQFESRLDSIAVELTDDLRDSTMFHDPKLFEQQVRNRLRTAFREEQIKLESDIHPYAFPDITLNGFGVEVKFTTKDT